MKRLRNSFLLGILSGIIGTAIGTLLYYVYLRYVAERSGIRESLREFYAAAWQNEAINMVIAIGTIFNLAFFFLFIALKWWRPAQGVIYATLAWLLVSAYFAFFR